MSTKGGANQLYRNNGDGTFTNIAGDNPAVQCSAVRTKGTSFADVDGDGDLDLYVVNWGVENRLFQNQTGGEDWLKVRLTGSLSNRMAVGSRVWVRDGATLKGMADLQTASGFCAQAPQEVHFGLNASHTYTVEVRFPSGTRTVIENVRPGQVLQVVEPSELASRYPQDEARDGSRDPRLPPSPAGPGPRRPRLRRPGTACRCARHHNDRVARHGGTGGEPDLPPGLGDRGESPPSPPPYLGAQNGHPSNASLPIGERLVEILWDVDG